MTNQPRVLTEEEEREIQARAEKATDGPWAWTHIGEKTNGYCVGFAMNTALEPLSGYVADSDDLVDPILIGEHEASAVNYGDADFIAHARQDTPALLASHRLLREERDRLEIKAGELEDAQGNLMLRYTASCSAYSNLEERAVEILGGGAALPCDDWSFDWYDGSMEIKGTEPGWTPTAEMRAQFMEAGVVQLFVSYKDGTALHFSMSKADGVGSPCSPRQVHEQSSDLLRRLKAENQKLRAALEKITAIPNDPCAGEGDDIDFAVDIARAALKEGE